MPTPRSLACDAQAILIQTHDANQKWGMTDNVVREYWLRPSGFLSGLSLVSLEVIAYANTKHIGQ